MTTYTVANQTQLNAAVRVLKGGDKIVLSGSSYDKLEMNYLNSAMKNVKFAEAVTITSLDKTKPAVIKALSLVQVANVKIDGVKFDHVGQNNKAFQIDGSTKVTIANSIFDGHKGSDGFGTGRALTVKNSSDVVIDNNKAANFQNAFGFSNSEKIVFSDNDVSAWSNDAVTIAGVSDILIENNKIHDGHSPKDLGHKDIIQVWTSANEGPSEKIVIRGNTFLNDEATHTIYMGNNLARTNPSLAYKDILIEDNVIKAGHTHGISVEHVNGLIVRDNLLERAAGLPDKMITTPIINVGSASVNVTIEGNTAPSVPKAQNGTWSVTDNVTEGKAYLHWYGLVKTGVYKASPSETYKAWLADDKPQPPVEPDGEDFRFIGSELSDSRWTHLKEFDFNDGDRLLLSDYENGSFASRAGGNALSVGTYGKGTTLDSVEDVAELAYMSGDVTAWVTSSNSLMVRIAQDGASDTFQLYGMGDEYSEISQSDWL